MNNSVCLNYVDNYNVKDLQQILQNCFDQLGSFERLKAYNCVMLKVCMPSSANPDSAECTHPSVVRAVVNLLEQMGIKCVVVESPYKKYNTQNLDLAYLNSGLLEVANYTDCQLNHDLSTCEFELPDGKMTKCLCLLDMVNKVDAIINIGKIKIDTNLGYFGAMANLFGLVPGELKTFVLNRLGTQRDFGNYLLDIYSAISKKLVLNILDGVVALENGETQRMMSCLLVGENIFQVDKTVLDILKIKKQSTYLGLAEERGFYIGQDNNLTQEEIKKFEIPDFALAEFDLDKKLDPSVSNQKSFFFHNQKRVVIDPKKCKGCSICSKICPTGAILMKYDKNEELFAEVNYKKCIFCYKCLTACPYSVTDVVTPTNYKKLEKEIAKQNQSE